MKIRQVVMVIGLGIFLHVWGCKSSNNESTEVQDIEFQNFPQIPAEKIQELWQNCDQLEIVFHEHPLSVNQGNRNDIRGSLGFISPETAMHHPRCRPIGRIFYNAAGETLQEADIYFSDECRYFMFMKDNKPAYAQQMMPEGINFFTRILQMQVPGH